MSSTLAISKAVCFLGNFVDHRGFVFDRQIFALHSQFTVEDRLMDWYYWLKFIGSILRQHTWQGEKNREKKLEFLGS